LAACLPGLASPCPSGLIKQHHISVLGWRVLAFQPSRQCPAQLQVKVSSGASCVLLLVELATQRCYCANVGAAACLISRISGSFNAKQPEGFFLTSEHTTR
jgi:hypothetical protein